MSDKDQKPFNDSVDGNPIAPPKVPGTFSVTGKNIEPPATPPKKQ